MDFIKIKNFCFSEDTFKSEKASLAPWLPLIIIATWEAEISQPRHIVCETLS
jgi:hypothetical protein